MSSASITRLGSKGDWVFSNEKHIEKRKINDDDFIQPPVIVVKRNKSVKVAFPERKLNKEIDQDKYPTPNMQHPTSNIAEKMDNPETEAWFVALFMQYASGEKNNREKSSSTVKLPVSRERSQRHISIHFEFLRANDNASLLTENKGSPTKWVAAYPIVYFDVQWLLEGQRENIGRNLKRFWKNGKKQTMV